MIAGVRVKVCGLRSLVDAEAADAIGADYLGFIFHSRSPRHIALEQWRALAPNLPARRRVAVSVLPTVADLEAWDAAGFDAFQVHFPIETEASVVAAWSAAVGPERLWLAPRLPQGTPFPVWLLEHARTILWDTYVPGGYGGSGRTGDWDGFRRASEAHPGTNWILAGGLGPANITEAIAATGARFVDVNSGVEAAPGIKDPARLQAFADALRQRKNPAPGRERRRREEGE